MAGHSHWHNIKHKKEKQDKIRAKNNKRYSTEIMSAISKGGTNIEYNSFLKSAIQAAKSNGVSKDVIEKAIQKAIENKNTDGELVLYEIFCEDGVAILASGFSDNVPKASAKIRELTSKYGAQISRCLHLFTKQGIAEIAAVSLDDIIDLCGALIIDYFEDNDNIIIIFDPNQLLEITNQLHKLNITRCEIIYIANELVPSTHNKKINQLINALEDTEFIHEIFHNIDI
jgi:YebC/PmpR family DNA-binding regulatory protein